MPASRRASHQQVIAKLADLPVFLHKHAGIAALLGLAWLQQRAVVDVRRDAGAAQQNPVGITVALAVDVDAVAAQLVEAQLDDAASLVDAGQAGLGMGKVGGDIGTFDAESILVMVTLRSLTDVSRRFTRRRIGN